MEFDKSKFDLHKLCEYLKSTLDNNHALDPIHVKDIAEYLEVTIHHTTVIWEDKVFNPNSRLISNCLVIFSNVITRAFFTDPQKASYTVNYIITKFDIHTTDYIKIVESTDSYEYEEFIQHLTGVIRSLKNFLYDLSPLAPQLEIKNKVIFNLTPPTPQKSVPKKLRYKAILDFIPDFNKILDKHHLTKNDKIKVINWITDASGEEGYKLICTEEKRDLDRIILNDDYLELINKMNKNK